MFYFYRNLRKVLSVYSKPYGQDSCILLKGFKIELNVNKKISIKSIRTTSIYFFDNTI